MASPPLRPACWNCGEPGRCGRCGSSELRNGRGDCAECHRQSARRQARLERDDFEVTPAMRAYLAAFDAWLTDRNQRTMRARAAALDRLENDRG